MNGYERAVRTLRFEPTDCVPTWGGWIASASFFEYVTGKHFWDDPQAIAIEAYRKLEVDMLVQSMYLPASPEEWRKHGPEVIEGSQKYRSAEEVIAYVDSLPDPEELEAEFDFEAQLVSVRDSYRKSQEDLGGDIFCLPPCGGPRFTWYMQFGYESYLMAIAQYPDKMRQLYEHSAETARLENTVRAELVRQGELEPFFFTGQDICGGSGPMVSPETLRAIYFPGVRHALAPLVEIEAEVIWHSDGFIIPIVDDLIECGVSGFQGFQEETGFSVGDIAGRTVRSSGRRPILLAGLSVDRVLPHGTVADVEDEVERIIDAVGSGGLAIGTANTPGPDCPDENLEALYRHVHEYTRSLS